MVELSLAFIIFPLLWPENNSKTCFTVGSRQLNEIKFDQHKHNENRNKYLYYERYPEERIFIPNELIVLSHIKNEAFH